MKICLVFLLAGIASASGWFFYEKPRLSGPFLFLRYPSRLAALNLPRGRNDRTGRHVPLNESPPMCLFKGPCDQIYHRNRLELKNLFEAEPVFRNSYESLYPRKMKGRQAPHQSRGGFATRNGLVYMRPNLMIVRPISSPRDFPTRKSAYSGFREVLYPKPTKPESLGNETQVLFRAFSEKPKVFKERIVPVVENRRTFTDASSQEPKTNSTPENSFLDVRPSSVRPYAVKEVVDESQLAVSNGTSWFGGKSLFVPNLNEETPAEARRKANPNSRIVKVIPLYEGNKTVGKNLRPIYPTSTDHFLRIVPSQNSQKPKELPINRKEQGKNLKGTPNWQENATETTADGRSGSRPSSTSGVKNWESFREITPDGFPRQNATAEIKYFSPANQDEIKSYSQKANQKSSSFTAEREFKTLQTSPPRSGNQAIAPFKTAATPEVTYTALEVENVTDIPENFTATWKFQNDPTPTREGNTVAYVGANLTTTEGFTEHPLNLDFLTPGADLKKNSRKMHFGQDSRPEGFPDQEQRRSDILISDNFDDYFDEEVNLSYLEKLKKNNSIDSLRGLTSNTLIPLIPVVIQDLRQGKIPPEDISLLSTAFGDRWKTVLELANSTNIDMLPVLKMKDESDLRNVLQSISHSAEPPTTTEATFTVDYDSYDYMEKFKDLYEDILIVGQDLEGNKDKRPKKAVTDWKRSGKLRAKRQG